MNVKTTCAPPTCAATTVDTAEAGSLLGHELGRTARGSCNWRQVILRPEDQRPQATSGLKSHVWA